MQQELFESRLREVRAETQATRQAAADLHRFRRALRPLRLANLPPLRLKGWGGPQPEVPVPTALRLNKTVRFLHLLDRPPRETTFGRGQVTFK
jgi:hypothetical protein